MKRQFLFVTNQNEDFDEGLTYTTELAKLLDKDVTLLIADNKKKFTDSFYDLMTTVTLAEANEHKIARKIVKRDYDSGFTEKIQCVIEKCSEIGVNLSIHNSELDIVTAIKTFLKEKNGIDMVLLGPGITNNGTITAQDLKRLVRTTSRPIIIMTK